MFSKKLAKKILSSIFTPFLIVVMFVLLFFVCQHNWFLPAQASDSPDAIGIRVMPNPNHYSPLSWYYKNIANPGHPQALIIDGYEAVRDGRSVYVNAANIQYNKDSSNNEFGYEDMFTNIYIISYNQDADITTKDIFGQILKYWKFNTRLVDNTGEGECVPLDGPNCKTAEKDCRNSYLGYTCEFVGSEQNEKKCVKKCILDSDCRQDYYCNSDKAKVVRDVKRLSDIVEVNLALQIYNNKHGQFPELSSGSYLPNKSISVWPSWNNMFGKILGYDLPLDPVNRLGKCIGYDPVTCWNENIKSFYTKFGIDGNPVLPENSMAYLYMYNSNDNLYKFCANFETKYGVSDKYKCDNSWIGNLKDDKPSILIGNCVRSEGKFENCFIAVYGKYDIDWAKTEISPIKPASWGGSNGTSGWSKKGWHWGRSKNGRIYEGLTLYNTSLKNHKELGAKDVFLPSSDHYGIFRYSVKVYDIHGNFNEQEGTIKICSQSTCAEIGAECGRADDNCGGTLLCGNCDKNKKCINNKCK